MSFNWMPKATIALVGLTLAAAPALAQSTGSMFDQMPEQPAEQPPASAATPAAPSRMTLPEASATPAPANVSPMFDSSAQSGGGMAAECQGIQKTLEQRKNLVAKANTASNAKKKMTPAQACGLFNQLQANGAAGIKWIKAHKEPCSIPDSFSEGFAADHGKVTAIKVKVCTAAAQYSKMEAQAREQAQNGGGGGLLGGPGLSGSFKMPQGAL